MNKFGPLVKALRKSAGFTLEHVAQKLKSHKGYVSGIENEKVNPPSVPIVRRIFGVYAAELSKAGIQATAEDLVELAYASKAPAIIRARALERIKDNPLAAARIGYAAPQPPPTIAPAEPVREAV